LRNSKSQGGRSAKDRKKGLKKRKENTQTKKTKSVGGAGKGGGPQVGDQRKNIVTNFWRRKKLRVGGDGDHRVNRMVGRCLTRGWKKKGNEGPMRLLGGDKNGVLGSRMALLERTKRGNISYTKVETVGTGGGGYADGKERGCDGPGRRRGWKNRERATGPVFTKADLLEVGGTR